MIEEMNFAEGEDPCPTIKWDEPLTEEECKTGVEKLVCFVGSLGIDCKFAANESTRYSMTDNKVYVNSNLLPKNMYHALIHEIGHVMVMGQLRAGEADCTPYLLHYPGFVGKEAMPAFGIGVKTKRFWFSRIHEEMDAWRKGMDVVTMLGLPLSLYDYVDRASKSVYSYIDYSKSLIEKST